jgi:hypothetical protein
MAPSLVLNPMKECKMPDEQQAAAARSDSDDWNTPFVASMTAVMPNGGTVTMKAPPAHSFPEGIEHLRQTHALYLEWGGWGGGR